MKMLTVFDPAMCCSTGVCGSDVDQVLVNFSADVQWLKGRGVQIERYNLAQQPMSFVENEKAKAFLEASGAEGLPLLLQPPGGNPRPQLRAAALPGQRPQPGDGGHRAMEHGLSGAGRERLAWPRSSRR